MKLKIVILFLLVVIIGCRKKEAVIGVYHNYYEKKAIHYVELFSDSTFSHIYIKNGTKKENKGKWHLSCDKGETNIVFVKWVPLGDIQEKFAICSNCIECVRLKNGHLFFSMDLYDEMNFKKD